MTEEEAIATLSPRHRGFFVARKQGFSYAEIGRDKKVSRERACHIILAATRKIKALMEDPEGWTGLSVRARNCICAHFNQWYNDDFRASKADVKKAISDGWQLMNQRNLGKKTAREIMEWAGVPKICPCCGQRILK